VATVTVDVAGGPSGGAARYRDEFYRYLSRTGRQDVRVIGADRYLGKTWLVRREMLGPARGRRVAPNNVSFIGIGGERWTMLGNALHFLTENEESRLEPSLARINRRKTAIVRLAARRSDILIAPCSAMAERVIRVLPWVRSRLVVRLHPVSADPLPRLAPEPVILCPVIFHSYKNMTGRLSELVDAVEGDFDSSVRVLVTAGAAEMPGRLAAHPRVGLLGRLDLDGLAPLWARCRAVYFPTSLESFGYPLAEARVLGRPVIARDTAQNREIAGPALCGFSPGDRDSLKHAIDTALTTQVTPDPRPFDPDAYFDWLLGPRP
jgi:glycosyltransferase involved in cell wall biosynthesis